MKLSLVYNARAGDGVSPQGLLDQLERAGHTVVHVLETKPDPKRAAEDDADMVVVAGGDGTVARAAIAMAGQSLPLAILPLGTANNIAMTLGLVRSLPEIVGSWKRGHKQKFNLGHIWGPWGEGLFAEGVGAGLITAGIAAMDQDPTADLDDPEESLEKAIRTYRTVLASLRAKPMTVVLDGKAVAKDLLLLEVLNIRSVGANVVVSAGADPSDGFFDVVMAGEEHREQIDAYLRRRAEGIFGHLDLPTRRATRIEVAGCEAVHVDDEIHPLKPKETLQVRMHRSGVELWV